MTTSARTDAVIATSRAYIRGPVMYALFVPARRLRNVTVLMAMLAFLLAPFWTSYSALLAPAMALTGIVGWHLVHANRRVPLIPGVMALMACIQWIVAPWLCYALQEWMPINRMPLDSQTYFAYFVPATFAYVLGLGLPLLGLRAPPNDAPQVQVSTALRVICDVMIFGGVFLRLGIEPYIPGSLRYIMALFSHLMYVGAFARALMRAGGWRWRICLVLGVEFMRNAIDAQFADALIWLLLTSSLVLYCRRVSPWISYPLGLAGLAMLFAINGYKGGYRDTIRYEGIDQSERPGMVATGVASYALTPSMLLSKRNVAMNIARLNEGWIAGRVLVWVPYLEPYAEGETVRTAIVATVVPRFLDPNKFVAGGKDNVPRFTGLTLDPATSMNLSIPGEMYANYSFMGGLLGTFIVAMLLGGVFRMFVRWGRTTPLAFAWAPYLLFGAVSPEMGIYEVIGTLGKTAVIASLVIFGTQTWRAQLPLSVRRLLSFSGSASREVI